MGDSYWTETVIFTLTENPQTVATKPQVRLNDAQISLVSFRVPFWFNISDTLKTNYVENSDGSRHTLHDALYAEPLTLVQDLNDEDDDHTWTFFPSQQKVVVSASNPFSMNDSRLLNLILGFTPGQIDGSSVTYTAESYVNLFPFSHYLIVTDKLDGATYYGESRRASFAVDASAYDYINGQTTLLDTTSLMNQSVTSTRTVLFPITISLLIRFTDGATEPMPVSITHPFNITLMVTHH